MIKLLHASFFSSLTSGVMNQLIQEKRIAKRKSLNWDVFVYSNKLKRSHPLNINKEGLYFEGRMQYVFEKIHFLYALKIKSTDCDIILLRYDPSNPFLAIYLYFFKPKGLYLVFHTIEVEEIKANNSRFKWVKIFLEKSFGWLSVRCADGIIAVTREIGVYQSRRGRHEKFFIYPNGIDYNGNLIVSDQRSDRHEFIFVASFFSPWQGLDLLLDAASTVDLSFKIHIIGEISEFDAIRVTQDRRFIYHGTRSAEYIRNIAASCSVGISCLALYRKGLTEASALKVRDYLAMGLPVVGNYYESFGLDFPYYKKIPVDILKFIEYANQFKKTSRHEISTYSSKKIDKSALMAQLYSQLSASIKT